MIQPGAAKSSPLAGNSRPMRMREAGIRVVITGKGGVGKTTLCALLAHRFAASGKQVLAVDGDPQKNLAVTLGIAPGEAGRIVPVSESTEYLRQKIGAGPGFSSGGLITLNPDVSDVVNRFAVPVSRNLRLLVMGGVRQAGSGCLCPEYTLLSAILRQMPLFPDDVVLLDTPAGLEHFGRAVAEGFSCAVVITDPSYNALTVARESAALAGQLGIAHVILAVNRAGGDAEERNVRTILKGIAEFPEMVVLPFDPLVARAEPSVVPLIAGESAFMAKVRVLIETLTARCEVRNQPTG